MTATGGRYAALGFLVLFLLTYGASGKKSSSKRGSSNGKKSSSSSSPNIIFILADDLGWNAGNFGEYGDDSDMYFATPNLDSYASKGIKLTNYYTQEVCTPTRAALMTGRYPLTIGMQYGNIDPEKNWGVNLTETLFPQALKNSGGDYTAYMLGKWNIGNFSPRLLPSARGFDYYLAYQAGATTYWSKKHPSGQIFDDDVKTMNFQDLTYGDGSCYASYSGDDKHDYSTYFYRDKAINVIKHHDYDKKALFLYLAFQATHDPFEDIDFENGVPKTYVPGSTYAKVKAKVVGRRRRQLALSLYLLDSAVKSVVEAVDDAGQRDNTYFIFTSDNGGCYLVGGRNGPLRGNKGTLFEGGTKVNAFIYSRKFSGTDAEGSTYAGLFHVTDWFPTMLDMAAVSYTPASGYELDGVSHWSYLQSGNVSDAADGPREYLLYNYYTDVDSKLWDNAVRGIRNSDGYKLLETYADNDYDDTNDADEVEDADDDLGSLGTCNQGKGSSGTFTYFLFDLESDPYEKTNLFKDSKYADIIADLASKLDEYKANSREDVMKEGAVNEACYASWKAADNTIVPWIVETEGEGYPTFNAGSCDHSLIGPLFSEGDDDDDFRYIDDDNFVDTKPTQQPTHKPSRSPTFKPSHKPTHAPTSQPVKTQRGSATLEPTPQPSEQPTFKPSELPTHKPNHRPSDAPSSDPTHKPTHSPSLP